MNPIEFLGSQIDEDRHKFNDKFKKIFEVMQLTGRIKMSCILQC